MPTPANDSLQVRRPCHVWPSHKPKLSFSKRIKAWFRFQAQPDLVMCCFFFRPQWACCLRSTSFRSFIIWKIELFSVPRCHSAKSAISFLAQQLDAPRSKLLWTGPLGWASDLSPLGNLPAKWTVSLGGTNISDLFLRLTFPVEMSSCNPVLCTV